MKKYIQELWNNYRAEALFFVLLSASAVLSHWLSRFIPAGLYENAFILVQHGANTAISFTGAWLLFSHSDGLRIRKYSAYVLTVWGLAEMFFLFQTCCWGQPVLIAGNEALTAYMLIAGNFLGWLLLIYPTETLRPGWMNWKIALWQLLPLVALWGLDYIVPLDLRWIISLYPVALFGLVLTHIRAYRIWCENNYSSMEHIDVQWIVRYLIMLSILGASYGYMMISDHPCRAFTQNWLIEFMFIYSIGEILFRKDPWTEMKAESGEEMPVDDDGLQSTENRQKLEQWLEAEKPYLNPDFKLMDLRVVMPMNRTYLSQFVNDNFGCSFYLLVSRCRVEEAKRIMREHPEMKISEVATLSGFKSQALLTHAFSKETGLTPREWSKQP
jgi:AraC-like DNA-binding protein